METKCKFSLNRCSNNVTILTIKDVQTKILHGTLELRGSQSLWALWGQKVFMPMFSAPGCASYTKVFNSYLLNELQYLMSQFSSLPLLREKVHVGLVTKKNQCSLAFPLGPGLIYIFLVLKIKSSQYTGKKMFLYEMAKHKSHEVVQVTVANSPRFKSWSPTWHCMKRGCALLGLAVRTRGSPL